MTALETSHGTHPSILMTAETKHNAQSEKLTVSKSDVEDPDHGDGGRPLGRGRRFVERPIMTQRPRRLLFEGLRFSWINSPETSL